MGKKALLINNDPQGNLTTGLGYTPAEQPRTLANLLLAAIDYPEDLEFHLQKAIIHTDTGIDLIPANRRLADAAAGQSIFDYAPKNAAAESYRSLAEEVLRLA